MNKKHGTFKGGIHPNYNKQYTDKLAIEVMPAPKEIVLPMSMHIGAPCNAVVAVGDCVKMGQLVAEAGGFVSANIHSSVSGKVLKIEQRQTANGKQMCIVIENDFLDTLDESILTEAIDVSTIEPKQVVDCAANAGLVGLGGATFPTRVKLSPPPDSPIDYVIINAAECEPYLTSDHAIMREDAIKVVGGLKLMMKALNLSKGYIGIEDNKMDAVEALRAVSDDSIEIRVLHTKYPQGSEKHLITAITGREVPSGALPSAVGCIVSNSGTALALYDAVTLNLPLIQRVVTVTGSGINTPKVLRFRLGTLVSEIIEYCGGLSDGCKKVILGGPMMGFAQFDVNVPGVKGTSGILCLNEKDAFIAEPSNCIRCGKCTEVCPMALMPLYLGAYSSKANYDACADYHIMDCIECGSCAYTCPARRPLVASIRVAKNEIRKNAKR